MRNSVSSFSGLERRMFPNASIWLASGRGITVMLSSFRPAAYTSISEKKPLRLHSGLFASSSNSRWRYRPSTPVFESMLDPCFPPSPSGNVSTRASGRQSLERFVEVADGAASASEAHKVYR